MSHAKSLNLYILHSIFDVAGAAAHFKPNGSLTMHEETWQFFNATRQALEKLHPLENNSIEEAYHHYMDFRGACISISRTDPESIALIRIAGLARLATPTQGAVLVSVFKQLPPDVRATLVRELNVHGGQGMRAIFVGYGVAMLLNPQGALQKELSAPGIPAEARLSATIEGFSIGLIQLANAFNLARNIIGDAASNTIFVAECDAIARALNKNPRDTLKLTWKVAAVTERRMDFEFASPSIAHDAASGGSVMDMSVSALLAMTGRTSSPVFNAKAVVGFNPLTGMTTPKL